MRKLLALLLWLLPGVAFAQVQVRLLEPAPGTILHPGDLVQVRWSVLAAGSLTGCEQELLLSLDGGRTNTVRMSRMLAPTVRQVNWTVPDIASKNAVIDLRFWCNGMIVLEPPAEVPQHPQVQSPLVIVGAGTRSPETVALAPFAATAVAPGDSLTLAWKSSVVGVEDYEVLLSYDRGNHFHSLGTTPETELEWTAPQDTFGGVIFQVIARRADGSMVSSVVPVRDHVTVRPRG
jgi:hypothetical protein